MSSPSFIRNWIGSFGRSLLKESSSKTQKAESKIHQQIKPSKRCDDVLREYHSRKIQEAKDSINNKKENPRERLILADLYLEICEDISNCYQEIDRIKLEITEYQESKNRVFQKYQKVSRQND